MISRTKRQKFMKRQSVEDYVKERFEMNSPVDEYDFIRNIKEETSY